MTIDTADSRSVSTGRIAAKRPDLNVAVIQDGARLRYALPLALRSAGILGTMHTDWFIQPNSLQALFGLAMASISAGTGRRLAGRRCVGLEGSQVVTSGWQTLLERLLESRATLPEEIYVRRSRAMTRQVLDAGWHGADALVGFVRNLDPLLCEVARRQGLAVVADQIIAPIDEQIRQEARQAELWPGWENSAASKGAAIMRDIERRTWDLADHVTCASDYVREGLLQAGVGSERVSVLPYPIDLATFRFLDRSARRGPVRVGFVGGVSLRKGAPAFLEIARSFDPEIARFTMVGPVSLLPERLAPYRGRVQLTGGVPADGVRSWLESFDIFLFPSACEGSAGTVMEAMATGLPVVTTPNSGTPVRDGLEGYIHACGDVDAMKVSIERLIQNPDLRLRMGRAARQRVETMTIERYGEAWRTLLLRLTG
ncbi:glycosyl transferase [Kaistia sp. 32K]|uniref:glycosyltransferase family 4 protein n=1 Tax=Kaistia sp. 32K TaxID=2795690 RepID=UPI001915EDDA|nr:glycosyltransferase family 4 protein [Kaistia sp. 32K]BCP53480.1 glycosyl transferase [Kaistia sp. 32K]